MRWMLLAALAMGVGQAQAAPKTLKIKAGKAKTSGDLAKGKTVKLRFASLSSMACWPTPHNKFFDGNHVFYKVKIPPKSELTITAKPKGKKTDISLYAYSGGGGKLPPHVKSVVSCEASYGTNSRKKPHNPGKSETVKLVATKNGYDAVIAVAGVKKGKKGKFDLSLSMKTAKPAPKGKVKRATKIAVRAGKTFKKPGKLDGSPIIDLSFAARSDVACFPNPQFKHFNGGHVVYKTKIPAKSVMNIRAVPKSKKLDLSLYAWMGGGGKLPPALHQAITCEASYGTKSRSKPFNPGKTEKVRLNATKNGYDVYIAVAGAQGVNKGAFTLEVDLETAKAAPTGKVKTAKAIKVKAGKTKVKGKLDGGPVIDLSFAARSDVACFPNPQFKHFNGAHVVYKTKIPPHSVMNISAKPKGKKDDISLYAWMGGGGKLPPALHRAITCEASYGTKSRSKPFNPGKAEKVRLNAIKNGYDVYIAVAGVKGLKKGAFEIEIDLETKAAAPTGKVKSAKSIKVKAGKTKVKGKLDGGPQIDLSFAARSDVACFPNPQFKHFNGAHVVYKTKIPPHSVMNITAKPKSGKTDLSLYAWMGGGDKLPPALHRAITCEASYGTNSRSKPFNPGKAEKVRLNAIKNGYDVYIAVAGAQKTMKGGFDLEIDLKTKAAAPTGKVKSAKAIKVKAGTTKVNGKLDGGPQIALDWAARSDVACFPNTASAVAHFNGAHVVYKTKIPPKSVMHITATPKSSKTDLSLYAWMGSSDKLPPAVHRAITCEASYGTNSMSKPFNPGKAEKVRLNAIKNGYDVYIGVAGVQKEMKGAFELKIDLETKAAGPSGKVKSAKAIKGVAQGKTVKVTDKLDGGPQIALDWAARSDVACFPNPQFKHFNGAHKVYSLKIPKYSNMEIKLIPKDKKSDLSLYAWMGGGDKLPPAVHRAITCEASYGTNKMSQPFSPGKTEVVKLNAINNPYDVHIGVAGAQKLMKGAYTIEIKTTKR